MRRFGLHAVLGLAAFVLVPAIQVAQAAPANPADDGWTVGVFEENDSFIPGLDKHYTQGFQLQATTPRLDPAGAAHGAAATIAGWSMLPNASPSPQYRYSFFFGQTFFTPENKLLVQPNPRDRPYAGWLYGGARLFRDTGDVLDRAEVQLGMVGPGAGGEYVQNSWHVLVKANHVNGWSTQLRDEPGLQLAEQRSWRLPALHVGPFAIDALPEITGALGNVFTYFGGGGMLRFGSNLEADWGPPRIMPAVGGSDYYDRSAADGLTWYIYGGAELRWVAHNIFLDGNSFRAGPSVAKEPAVADVNGGIALMALGFRFSGSYTHRTAEFATQTKDDEFIAFHLSKQF